MEKYFMSDPHAYHKNICKGSTNWTDIDRCRPFNNEFEMTDILIQNINHHVKYDDILYCLGDWSFGGSENIKKFRDRLNVRTIHLTFGNHDHNIINKNHNRSLFTSCQFYLDKKVNGQRIIMSHYSMRTWDKAHHGSWMLYGHSHGMLPQYIDKNTNKHYKTMDVGVDTIPEFRPYHFDEIKDFMDKGVDLRVDHHSNKTN